MIFEKLLLFTEIFTEFLLCNELQYKEISWWYYLANGFDRIFVEQEKKDAFQYFT